MGFAVRENLAMCKLVYVDVDGDDSMNRPPERELTMVGERLRAARRSQNLSLQDVADKADISVATLSRIETGKQALDVTLLLLLAKILNRRPSELIEPDDESRKDDLATRLSAMDARSRRAVWQELAEASRSRRSARKKEVKHLASEVEELLAQIDFVRAEIEGVKRRLR